MLASLATKTGTSNAARSPSASGVPCQPRLGASTTTPAASTTPGVPTPMPSTGRVAASTSSRTMVVDEGDGVLAAATLERLAAPFLDVAGEVEQRPGDDPVGGEVDGHDLAGLARPAARAPGACRPGPGPGPRTSPVSSPSATRSPTTSETVTRVSPLERARSARLAGP